jgi:uncharacterized protein with NAD-binding domain and iron-sulfur cluster
VIAEQVEGRWEPWPLPFPPMPGKPGVGATEILPPLGYVKKLLSWLSQMFTGAEGTKAVAPDLASDIADVEERLRPAKGPNDLPTRGIGDGEGDIERSLRVEELVDELYAQPSRQIVAPSTYLYLSRLLGDYNLLDPSPRLVWLLQQFRSWLSRMLASSQPTSTVLRRLWILLDLGISTTIGILKDIVASPDGARSLDDLDLRDWLEKHGASPAARNSAPLRALYNLVFSGPGQIAAGSLLRGFMRMLFGYKEAIFHKMQAGMGDTIFAPLYEVLKRRGVKFEFFHRVDELVLSPDKKRITAIEMGRQARPKGGEYDPLYDVKGLPCWPSEPLYDRIQDGDALKQSGQNLESWWNSWPDVEARRLELGKDFDRVILGIAIGAFPQICKQLIDAPGPFGKMVEHVKTAQTQAVQLWLRSDLAGLGWPLASPVLDGFADPFDTWADMTHLLPREQWPEGDAPRHIAYLCSRLPDDEAPPPRSSSDFSGRQASRTRENALEWLNQSAGALWPRAVHTSERGQFDWSLLVDPDGRVGADRFESQHWQVPLNPSDRYVLGVPGSSKHRLRAGESGFENLLLAGDWVKTGLNAGCVEAATMAGLQASQAICGHPAVIPGDDAELRPGAAAAQRAALPARAEARESPAAEPRYVERGGELVVRQPLLMRGVTSYSFVLGARLERLAALADRYLNGPAKNAVRYVPAGPFVVLVCADIARGQACDDPDRSKGWMAERDVAFWVPLWAGKQVGPVFIPQRLVFMLPYVFVDNIAAAITGREIYGFHKETGVLRFPASPAALGSFSIDTLVIAKHGPESAGEVRRLIDVQPSDAGASRREPAWGDVDTGLGELGQRLRDLVLKGLADSAAEAARQAMRTVGAPQVRMVFLKQLRDVADPGRACYQAIVEAPAVVKAIRAGGALPAHQVRIAPVDSHPIASDLGLAGEVTESLFGSWLDFDFAMEAGTVVWSAEGLLSR